MGAGLRKQAIAHDYLLHKSRKSAFNHLRQLQKPKLARWKRVTIIAGFCGAEGVLIAADREESTQVSKREVSKIQRFPRADYLTGTPQYADHQWVLLIATAGDSTAADYMALKIAEAFEKHPVNDLCMDHRDILDKVVAAIYKKHIAPDKDAEGVSLILSIAFGPARKQFLYWTDRSYVMPCDTYKCLGYGDYLANYLAERLYERGMGRRETIKLAAFIMREVKAACKYCGKGTDMQFVGNNNTLQELSPRMVEDLEQKIPDVWETMRDAWNQTIIPWLKFPWEKN
jgi:20S proteasome alpha/beta subunit